MSLRISMLGPLAVERDGEKIQDAAWGDQQTRTTLQLLLIRRDRIVPTDQRMDILWPDDDPDTASDRLYVPISQLRRLSHFLPVSRL